ncbi:MAG: BSP peptidase [Podoviridae sp. ctg2L5]|nr:MAG: BSP peptidase [Podoviridae sp. ctg2L5]
MKIPKEFKLVGQTIKVKFESRMAQKDDIQGAAHYRFNELHIQPNSNGHKRTREQIEETFCHELTHFILNSMEIMRDERVKMDEKFVGLFGSFLHQALSSFKGELK